ncbi:hypothetical protein DRO97_09825, partial [Archaeoglobales archaeon]
MNNSKKTILILSPFFRPNIGGVETHLDDLCEYLRRRGHKVFVITYQPLTTKAKGQKLERKENLEIRRIRWFGYNWFHKLEPYPIFEWLYLFPGLFVYTFLFFLKYRNKIDVIHAHGLISALITKILAKVFNKRSVVTIHAVYGFKGGSIFSKFIKWILSSFDVIFALSIQSEKELIRIGLKNDKIKVFTHWVDQFVFKPLNKEECKKKIRWENKFIVLLVGRLIEIKGIYLLIEAAKKLI